MVKYTNKTKGTETKRLISVLIVLLSGVILVTIPFLDKFYFKSGFLEENVPIFSTGQILRSLIILISLSAMIFSLINLSLSKPFLIEIIGIQFEKIFLIVTDFLAMLFLIIFLVAPLTFSNLSKEDGLIEWSSMILSLCGSFIFIASLLRSRKSQNIPLIVRGTFLLFGLLLFLIAMEEISWFQRILKFQTPNEFSHNSQNEFNFHNFATNLSENIYYFGTFLFLAVLPFAWRILYGELSSGYSKLFIPKPYITIIYAIACAFNYDMWNIFFTQISFFTAIIVLFVFYKFTKKRHEKFIFIFTIFLVAVTQVIFLFNGENFSRIWDVTEYKEFFIPLAFLAYAWGVYRNVNHVYLVK